MRVAIANKQPKKRMTPLSASNAQKNPPEVLAQVYVMDSEVDDTSMVMRCKYGKKIIQKIATTTKFQEK